MKLVIPEFKGEYYFLSNFYRRDMTYRVPNGNLVFPTAEHAFQASKNAWLKGGVPARKEFVQSILDASTPTEARKLGRTVKGLDVATWDEKKIGVMQSVVEQKFAQHKDLRDLLVATGPAMLVEGNTWQDTYWGRVNGRGYNLLGVILMEVRGYYRLKPPF